MDGDTAPHHCPVYTYKNPLHIFTRCTSARTYYTIHPSTISLRYPKTLAALMGASTFGLFASCTWNPCLSWDYAPSNYGLAEHESEWQQKQCTHTSNSVGSTWTLSNSMIAIGSPTIATPDGSVTHRRVGLNSLLSGDAPQSSDKESFPPGAVRTRLVICYFVRISYMKLKKA